MGLFLLARNTRGVVGESRFAWAAATVFALLLACVAFGDLLAPHDPFAADGTARLAAPSMAHWFGTDALGRDIFSRVIVAARFDLGMAVLAVALSFVIGLAFGALAGYFGRWIDRVLGRVADAITAFPLFVLAMGIVVALGNGVSDMLVALVVIDLPFHYRLARSEVHTWKPRAWAATARSTCCGVTSCPTSCRRWGCRRCSGWAGRSSTSPGCRSSAWVCTRRRPSGG